mgnify:CR=1 FL=1
MFKWLSKGFKGLFDKVEESVLFDMSKPVSQQKTGGKHPISLVKKEVIDIFSGIGFCVSDGPEIEQPEKIYYDQAQRRMNSNNFSVANFKDIW